MRYISILMVIIVYWILLAVGINAVLSDPLVTESAEFESFNISSIDTTGMNLTSQDNPDLNTLSKWKNTLSFMFLFKTPNISSFPRVIAQLLSGINWMLALLMVICVYKIGNPISSA